MAGVGIGLYDFSSTFNNPTERAAQYGPCGNDNRQLQTAEGRLFTRSRQSAVL